MSLFRPDRQGPIEVGVVCFDVSSPWSREILLPTCPSRHDVLGLLNTRQEVVRFVPFGFALVKPEWRLADKPVERITYPTRIFFPSLGAFASAKGMPMIGLTCLALPNMRYACHDVKHQSGLISTYRDPLRSSSYRRHTPYLAAVLMREALCLLSGLDLVHCRTSTCLFDLCATRRALRQSVLAGSIDPPCFRALQNSGLTASEVTQLGDAVALSAARGCRP